MNPSEMQRKAPPRRRRHRNRALSTHKMNKMMMSEEQMKLPSTKKAEPLTWAQLKKLTQLATKCLENTKMTQTPESMLLAALMIVSTVHCILLVRAREGMWIPVSMDRLWEASPSIHILTEVLKGILNRSKRFIFTLITVIMGLIAVTAMAAIAGVALHSSVQSVNFVNDWQKNSTRLWNSQSGIDQKLANQINDLRQTVIWMGDRLMSLEYHFQLQCDWNMSDFCITPQIYNESEYHWDVVRRHLQGREDNLTLDISKLKEQIFETSKAHLNLVPGTEAIAGVADGLANLNPVTWVKTIGSTMIINFILILVCLFCLLLVCRCTQQL
ncbi:endogenous retrovirus group K member 25 Env polyprotein [Gorilla gorilla gorilla]|uniref:endogenous retrovirus group K member 25 Env polyprotein n=1 Tax=Gorilla gorilla gorilla TaxID=9595 RepID=UPI002445F612|nr:endogenous retrovirus group K member 25 Env polyprotein [Gorilla gorilla gorilla]